MSVLRYIKLFKLELLHDFYTDGNCPDFTVVPSAETAVLFSKLKIRIINTETGLMALYEAKDDSGTPSSPISPDTRFSFGLQLKTPSFTNYTDLAAKNTTADKYRYYSNTATGPTEPDFLNEVIPVFPNLINYEFSLNSTDSGGGLPVTILVKKDAATVLPPLEVESYDNAGGTYFYRAQLNLKNANSGIYEIYRQASPDNVLLKKVLVDPSLNSSQVFAVVDIFKSDNDYKDYSIRFNSKKVRWKYFVVLKNGDVSGITVVDTASSPVVFTLNSPDADDNAVIDTIVQQYPSAVVKVFKSPPSSDDWIPFKETSRTGIILKKSSVDLVPNLPNPNPKAAKPELFVYVDN